MTIAARCRVFLLAASLAAMVPPAKGQAPIWSDDFNNGCASECLASTWNGWTLQDNVGGTTGTSPNNWFVSCAEDGPAPPACGSTCVGDATLHIGASTSGGGDMGAAFTETGAVNATFRRIVSPPISTAGRDNLVLRFDFIAYGSPSCSDDRAQLHLSADGGATWPAAFQYCLTSVCCGACNGYSPGQWTQYRLSLPSMFWNNPDIRIGFHWRNNGNGSGTDPSVAIDDIRITGAEFDVSMTKSANVALAVPGSTVTYTVQARHTWQPFSADANNITVSDTFPAGLSGCSTTCSPIGGASCTAGPFTGNIQDVVNLPNQFFDPGYSAVTYTSVCTIAADASGTITNTATASPGPQDTDTNPADNTASVTIDIVTDGVFANGFE